MSTLERDTYTDGFICGLFEVFTQRSDASWMFSLRLFDGGRYMDEVVYRGSVTATDPIALGRAIALLYRLLPEPNVLGVYGNGWQDWFARVRPDLLTQLRILDIRGAALTLLPNLRPTQGMAAMALALGIDWVEGTSDSEGSGLDEVLWRLIGLAGSLGYTWKELIHGALSPRYQADFERFAFGAELVSQLPMSPAVYIMRDLKGQVLYVGKAANLATRFKSYFQHTWQLSPKLKAIRDQIHDVEFEYVGSELEALLVEHQLIQRLQPKQNVQRKVREERGCYGTPLDAILVFEPSRSPREFCLFSFGREQCIQMTINPLRMPRVSILRVMRFLMGADAKLSRTRSMTLWGRTGHAICCRYFWSPQEHDELGYPRWVS